VTTIYTLGHSNLDEIQFQKLLLKHSIETLVDIRSHPHSKLYSQFDEAQLRLGMEQCKIDYHWAGRQLGDMRKKQTHSRHSTLLAEHQAFADYMDCDDFKKAANQLISFASRTRLAIMCAEKIPDHCHRLLIADYLVLNGVEVKHIVPGNEIQSHILSSSARRESIDLIYDR
jgi:uncharacterized protein (DUF488 family)